MQGDKKVSYTEQVILTTLVKGIYDMETLAEVLSIEPHMNIADTILLIEARETRKRIAGILAGSSPASSQANNKDLVAEESEQGADRVESRRDRGRNGHGR